MIGNSPSTHTVIRVEARKSFVLGVHLHDLRGRPADLTGCQLRIVVKDRPVTQEKPNLLEVNSIATVGLPETGYAHFNIQAGTLDIEPQEYEFAIVLTSASNFTSVIVKGTFEVVQNSEFDSIATEFIGVQPAQTLDIQLQRGGQISVTVGAQLPPGMSYIRDEVLGAIESFDPKNVAYVPPGGRVGYVLTKRDNSDYGMHWRPVGNGAFALDATGVPIGQTPVAMGDGTWDWDDVGLVAGDAPDGYAPIANGDGTWSWAEINTARPDWNAPEGSPAEVLNKPELGTMAARDELDFFPTDTLVSEMAGIHFVTAVPTATPENEGHIYFVYTA